MSSMARSLLPEEDPDTYEIKAIMNFESKKKKDKFVPLNLL
jgi:hypothetical protein